MPPDEKDEQAIEEDLADAHKVASGDDPLTAAEDKLYDGEGEFTADKPPLASDPYIEKEVEEN